MSRKSYSEERIALIASCPYVKSVTEKAARYASSFMQILADEAEGGNVPMEGFFGRAKDEPHLRRRAAFGDVAAEIEDHVDHCNSRRPQAGLGKMAPAEFRDYLLAKPTSLPAPFVAARENGNPSLGGWVGLFLMCP